ncbi:hypothetical protein [Terriglobus aquaticus]|uniref:Porin n=1 Tax=Terriglobus aquaticus TaxID=940139 RepID=A0ABW9KJU7_9BACT|nr:hypothetical protein [Terriglobus aquaticus]
MAFRRTPFFFSLCAAAVCATAHGQATPTASAPAPYSQFALPDIGGELRYALTASESLVSGYNGSTGQGVSSFTSLGGDLAYLSANPRHQFSAVYAGGYSFGESSFPSYYYQSLTLSQGLQKKHWNFLIGDSISYLPQTPVGSLSGVPGVGDQGLPPVVITSVPTLGVLTTYGTRVSNTVSGTASRILTASTSLGVSGNYSIQRYTGSTVGGSGLDNDQESANASLQHRLNERMSVGALYSFGNSTFPGSSLFGPANYGFQTHTAQGTISRVLSPRLSLSASVGPQWTVRSGDVSIVTQTSTSVSATASLSYQATKYNASLNYTRGTNNGNGVVLGSEQDSVVGNISRPFARIYNVGGLVGWNHSSQLSHSILPGYNGQGVVAGGQISAQVSRSVSAFAAYTIQRQLFSGYAPSGIAFNGLTQYGSIGVTYSPKPIFGRK